MLWWTIRMQEVAWQDFLKGFGPLYHLSIALTGIEWFLDLTAHIFFSVKYWMASQKIKMVLSTKMDPNFNLKALILLSSLLVLAGCSGVLSAWLYWDPTKNGF
jgi:hypothetical protein